MSLILSGPAINPSGARTLLIMLHGYGATGDDLFALVRQWADDDLAVWAPDAPIPVGFGRCWFPLDRIEDRDLERTLGLEQTTEEIYHAMMKYVQAHQTESVILGGFSQGAMLALHMMARHQTSWPVLAYGGGFFTPNPARLDGAEVCLIHGAEDDVVLPQYLTSSMITLAQLGASVEGHLRPYVGHSIDLVGARIGRAFVQRHTRREA